MRTNIFVLFNIISTITFAQPVNDNCSNAISLSVQSTCSFSSYSNIDATNSTTSDPNCASYNGQDVWFSVVVPVNGSVTIETEADGMTDSGMSIYSGTCGALTEIECNDDGGTGNMSLIDLTGQTPGEILYIRVWDYNGGTGTFGICAVGIPDNATCERPQPVCSGTNISFETTTSGLDAEDDIDPGNDYGCLNTSPDPTWYYLEIDTGGDLIIDMTAGADIDFAIWGPFADLASAESSCESYGTPLDCGYTTSAVEQATVAGTVSGEVYVMVVTNYAATTQTITISDAATSSATTNCSIVPLSVEYGSFEVFGEEGRNRIEWSTLSEKNSDYFILEKSTDTKVWEFVAIRKAAGNSIDIIDYVALDDSPTRNGIDYYRLKQFDLDGSVELSHIIFINNVENMEFSLLPNPADNQVKVSSQSKFDYIELIDLSGKIVWSNKIVPTNSLLIDLSEVINGVYLVKVSDLNGNSQMKKLIVQ